MRINTKCGLILLTSMSCAALSACSSEAADDYCRDHYLFHDEHRATTAQLEMVVTDAGSLSTKLMLPTQIFDSADDRAQVIVDELQSSKAIYSMAAESGCSATGNAIAEQGDSITATYQSQCDAGTDLDQVNVSLFDLLPELDEVEVRIKTDATAKHFAISRQCSAAIFRINQN